MVACQQLLLVVKWSWLLPELHIKVASAWRGALNGRFSRLKVRVDYITMSGT